jgi:hypothetical protein
MATGVESGSSQPKPEPGGSGDTSILPELGGSGDSSIRPELGGSGDTSSRPKTGGSGWQYGFDYDPGHVTQIWNTPWLILEKESFIPNFQNKSQDYHDVPLPVEDIFVERFG